MFSNTNETLHTYYERLNKIEIRLFKLELENYILKNPKGHIVIKDDYVGMDIRRCVIYNFYDGKYIASIRISQGEMIDKIVSYNIDYKETGESYIILKLKNGSEITVSVDRNTNKVEIIKTSTKFDADSNWSYPIYE